MQFAPRDAKSALTLPQPVRGATGNEVHGDKSQICHFCHFCGEKRGGGRSSIVLPLSSYIGSLSLLVSSTIPAGYLFFAIDWTVSPMQKKKKRKQTSNQLKRFIKQRLMSTSHTPPEIADACQDSLHEKHFVSLTHWLVLWNDVWGQVQGADRMTFLFLTQLRWYLPPQAIWAEQTSASAETPRTSQTQKEKKNVRQCTARVISGCVKRERNFFLFFFAAITAKMFEALRLWGLVINVVERVWSGLRDLPKERSIIWPPPQSKHLCCPLYFTFV